MSFGARTITPDPEWRYVPVRRTAIMLRVSIYNGIQWAVFEPNDEPLWAQLRLNIGAFMMTLFRQGAFQGATPAQAFFVKCDGETTTQADIDVGVVNVLVGFAPLKPADFVVVRISQKAGPASAMTATSKGERRVAKFTVNTPGSIPTWASSSRSSGMASTWPAEQVQRAEAYNGGDRLVRGWRLERPAPDPR